MMLDPANVNMLENKDRLHKVSVGSKNVLAFFYSIFFFMEALSTHLCLSISGNKKPHFGELHFQEFAFKLKLKSKAEEGEAKEYEKTKKTIDLKGH